MKPTIALIASVLLAPLAGLAAAGQTKPNVILTLADDLGYSDIGCYGGEIHTPNIDRLAREGLRFRQFYNNAKCTATRTSLLSGCYPCRANNAGYSFWDNQTYGLGQAMKAAGYYTILSGKWHAGPGGPEKWSFDESYGLVDGCSDYFSPVYKGHRKFALNGQPITTFPENFYATDAYTDFAVAQMKQAISEGKPFFLHLAYTAPHYPLQAKPEDIAKYQGKYDGGWEKMRAERYQRMIKMGVISSEEKLSPPDPLTKTQKAVERAKDPRIMEVYAAMIDCMDQGIGKVLKVLDDAGTADNTIIIFLSDNGGNGKETPSLNAEDHDPTAAPGARNSYWSLGADWASAANTPYRMYKLFDYEGGMRTPCIVRWPKMIKPGTWTDAIGDIMDVEPTLMAIAGLNPVKDVPDGKRPLDGENILPVLQGQPWTREKPIFLEWTGNRAMRDGDWKIDYLEVTSKMGYGERTPKWELYNMAQDPTELTDLSSQYPEKFQQMTVASQKWADEHGVSVNSRKNKNTDAEEE